MRSYVSPFRYVDKEFCHEQVRTDQRQYYSSWSVTEESGAWGGRVNGQV